MTVKEIRKEIEDLQFNKGYDFSRMFDVEMDTRRELGRIERVDYINGEKHITKRAKATSQMKKADWELVLNNLRIEAEKQEQEALEQLRAENEKESVDFKEGLDEMTKNELEDVMTFAYGRKVLHNQYTRASLEAFIVAERMLDFNNPRKEMMDSTEELALVRMKKRGVRASESHTDEQQSTDPTPTKGTLPKSPEDVLFSEAHLYNIKDISDAETFDVALKIAKVLIKRNYDETIYSLFTNTLCTYNALYGKPVTYVESWFAGFLVAYKDMSYQDGQNLRFILEKLTVQEGKHRLETIKKFINGGRNNDK